MHRYIHAKQTSRTTHCSQINWSTPEVMYDKHGEPFDTETTVRKGIVDYYKSNCHNGK